MSTLVAPLLYLFLVLAHLPPQAAWTPQQRLQIWIDQGSKEEGRFGSISGTRNGRYYFCCHIVSHDKDGMAWNIRGYGYTEAQAVAEALIDWANRPQPAPCP